VITGRRQNRVDRSHSMSMKMDAPSNDLESLTHP